MQVLAQQSRDITHTCQSTHIMNKSSDVDYAKISTGTKKFDDKTFLTTDALFWADMG